MKAYLRISVIIVSFLTLIFWPHFTLAQNVDALRLEIYSKLKCCPCKETFVECRCAEAKEMKAYIDGLLENNASREDILYKVAKKFSPKVIIDQQIKADLEQCLLKESGGKFAKVIFEPLTLNFGALKKIVAKTSKMVRIYNKGNMDLVITNLRVSCDCVAVSLKTKKSKSPYFGLAGAIPGWQAIIEPGDFGELEVVLDLGHSSMGTGKQIRNIFVSSNDPVNPQADLKAEVEIQ